MSKKSELSRNSKLSYVELNQTADRFILFADRDFVELEKFGLTKKELEDYRKLRAELAKIPSDAEILAGKSAVTEKKDSALEELKKSLKAVIKRIKLHFGKNSLQLKKAGGENVSDLTDAEYCQKGHRVERAGREYFKKLQTDGLTEEMLDKLKKDTNIFDDLIDLQKEREVQREIKTRVRIKKANELYEAVVRLSDLGKAAFEDVDAARYESYKINDKINRRSCSDEETNENEGCTEKIEENSEL